MRRKKKITFDLNRLDGMPVYDQMNFIRQLICMDYSVAFNQHIAEWCAAHAELIAATLKSER
jgi:hypothetical protein